GQADQRREGRQQCRKGRPGQLPAAGEGEIERREGLSAEGNQADQAQGAQILVGGGVGGDWGHGAIPGQCAILATTPPPVSRHSWAVLGRGGWRRARGWCAGWPVAPGAPNHGLWATLVWNLYNPGERPFGADACPCPGGHFLLGYRPGAAG